METMGMPLALPQKADKLSLTALGIIVVYNVSLFTHMYNVNYFFVTILCLINFGVLVYFILIQNKNLFEETQTKLTFTISPKFSKLIGIFLGVIGLFFLLFSWIITPIVQLTCTHYIPETSFTDTGYNVTSNVCELVEVDWFGSEKSKKVVSGLQRSELETKTDTDSNGKISYRYQVLLLTDTGSLPFRSFDYSEYESKKIQSVLSSINTFLANASEQPLEFQEDDSLQGYTSVAISLFLEFLALLIIALGSSITCTLDKEFNTMTLSRYRGFAMLEKTVCQHSLSEIVDVKLESLDADQGWVYRIVFVLVSGEIVPFTHVYSSGFQYKQQIAKILKKFLYSINQECGNNLHLEQKD